MKTKILNFVLAFALLSSATVIAQNEFDELAVNELESTVNWKGYKVLGEHEGTINVKKGTLFFDGPKLVNGTIEIDMTSINTTDLEGEMKGNLDGHLKSDDFFGTANHGTATLVIKSVEKGKDAATKASGELTIKGITHPITLEIEMGDDMFTASMKVDRTKYGIKYKSASFIDGLKDKAIKDIFDINATIRY